MNFRVKTAPLTWAIPLHHSGPFVSRSQVEKIRDLESTTQKFIYKSIHCCNPSHQIASFAGGQHTALHPLLSLKKAQNLEENQSSQPSWEWGWRGQGLHRESRDLNYFTQNS